MYLLDANVLITANNLYYPIRRFREVWDWIAFLGEKGQVKIPTEILDEIADGSEISRWLDENDIRRHLKLDEDVDPELVRRVLSKYALDLNDTEVIEIGRDPFLMASALRDMEIRIVVTDEVSKPSLKRGRRRIPDVCKDLQLPCCTIFQMMAALDFTTAWRADDLQRS